MGLCYSCFGKGCTLCGGIGSTYERPPRIITESVVEQPVKESEAPDKSQHTDPSVKNTTGEEKKGCGSLVAVGALVMAGLAIFGGGDKENKQVASAPQKSYRTDVAPEVSPAYAPPQPEAESFASATPAIPVPEPDAATQLFNMKVEYFYDLVKLGFIAEDQLKGLVYEPGLARRYVLAAEPPPTGPKFREIDPVKVFFDVMGIINRVPTIEQMAQAFASTMNPDYDPQRVKAEFVPFLTEQFEVAADATVDIDNRKHIKALLQGARLYMSSGGDIRRMKAAIDKSNRLFETVFRPLEDAIAVCEKDAQDCRADVVPPSLRTLPSADARTASFNGIASAPLPPPLGRLHSKGCPDADHVRVVDGTKANSLKTLRESAQLSADRSNLHEAAYILYGGSQEMDVAHVEYHPNQRVLTLVDWQGRRETLFDHLYDDMHAAINNRSGGVWFEKVDDGCKLTEAFWVPLYFSQTEPDPENIKTTLPDGSRITLRHRWVTATDGGVIDCRATPGRCAAVWLKEPESIAPR